MTSDQFCYWLQGFAELNEQPPSLEQWKSIREHLATVFNKITPPFAPSAPVPQPMPITVPYVKPYNPFEPIVTCEAKFCSNY